MDTPNEERRPRMVGMLIETFGLSPMVASLAAVFIIVVCLLAVVWFVRSAPPRSITLTSGRTGSTFQRFADAYQRILLTHKVDLRIIPSGGSEENLHRLESPDSGVDIGFVQSGVVEGEKLDGLVSLGSVAYQPLLVFYRGPKPISRLSELEGKRIAVGAKGSGTHALALALLQTNGITGLPTTLLDVDAAAAASALSEGTLDAAFLMGDSAPIQTLRTLVRSPDVQLYSFTQADAYVRRYTYLKRMVMPEGSVDFGKDLPAHDIVLIGPTVELVARKGLNSALSDLLIEVAQEVHGKASLLQRRGEFPAPLEHELKISDDALRYYKGGKGFIYRTVGSFWLSSLINRLLVAIIPVLLVLVPAIRFFPSAYRWTVQIRFYQCYRRLLRLEHDASGRRRHERDGALLKRLDEIEEAVDRLTVPAYFANQFYGLRGHIKFVRERLNAGSR